MHLAAGVALGFMPSLVVVLTLPLSAVTGWPAQSVGDVILGVSVISTTVWATST